VAAELNLLIDMFGQDSSSTPLPVAICPGLVKTLVFKKFF